MLDFTPLLHLAGEACNDLRDGSVDELPGHPFQPPGKLCQSHLWQAIASQAEKCCSSGTSTTLDPITSPPLGHADPPPDDGDGGGSDGGGGDESGELVAWVEGEGATTRWMH